MVEETEIWKHYTTYGSSCDGKTHYIVTDFEISNFGNVKPGILFKIPYDGSINIYRGRRCVASNARTKYGGMVIYRLVYQLFVGPIPKGYVVHHKDHNKLNDKLDNLVLMTKSDHMRLHQTGSTNKAATGLKWINNGETEQYIKKDEPIPEGWNPGRLKRKKGV